MLDNSTNQILNSLFDIASNIQISPNFSIQHPKYQPFSLPATVATRFQQNPQDLQHKYLSLLLRNFVHGIYYNGSLQQVLSVNHAAKNYSPHKSLEPNYHVGIDWDFYEQLHLHNHGRGHYDPNWQVLRLEPDKTIAVTKNGLTLYVEPECYLKTGKKSIKIGDLIAIWMPKNRLQNGCYIAVGNLGQEQSVKLDNNLQNNLGVGKIYFNVTPSGAIALMDTLTQQLNKANIPFSFEVLYNPGNYGRYDAGTLHFEIQNYPDIHKILQIVYQQHQSDFQPEIPLFTKFLAPGLSLAEEPKQKFMPQESFGMNRCQIVANALLEAWEKGKNAIEERMRIIDQHFAQNLIDVEKPYLNPSSEDIYIPLNC